MPSLLSSAEWPAASCVFLLLNLDLMGAQEWKFESPYPPAGRLLIISPVTHIACVCTRVCVGLAGRVQGVFGDRESGSATSEESNGLM